MSILGNFSIFVYTGGGQGWKLCSIQRCTTITYRFVLPISDTTAGASTGLMGLATRFCLLQGCMCDQCGWHWHQYGCHVLPHCRITVSRNLLDVGLPQGSQQVPRVAIINLTQV